VFWCDWPLRVWCFDVIGRFVEALLCDWSLGIRELCCDWSRRKGEGSVVGGALL